MSVYVYLGERGIENKTRQGREREREIWRERDKDLNKGIKTESREKTSGLSGGAGRCEGGKHYA